MMPPIPMGFGGEANILYISFLFAIFVYFARFLKSENYVKV